MRCLPAIFLSLSLVFGAVACSSSDATDLGSDVIATDTGSADGATPGPDAGGVACEPNGVSQCGDDGGVEVCTEGAWVDSRTCETDEICEDGDCVCAPTCAGVECGGDGCGGVCGACADGELCDASRLCVTAADCTDTCESTGATCGEVCGSACGTCAADQVCDPSGQCLTTGDCTDTCESTGATCGEVCGVACGTCTDSETCTDGACACTPSCDGVDCGDDGCGGSCGTCTDGATCGDDGLCQEPVCTPNCIDVQCGDDGCGGDCGTCAEGESCDGGQCVSDAPTVPCGDITAEGCCDEGMLLQCNDGELQTTDCVAQGADPCGWFETGSYYDCGGLDTPPADHPANCATECVPSCDNAQCGDDGCGGSCGTCTDTETCEQGQCVTIPTCDEGKIVNCTGGCTTEGWLGDGICDDTLNCEAFDYDAGDCPVPCPGGQSADCEGVCQDSALIGDGNCDAFYQCAGLGWDGGDCEVTCAAGTILNCTGGCTSESWLADNYCDNALNCEALAYDAGDCPIPCPEGQEWDCDGACQDSALLGDGSCDAFFQCQDMDWDDGDCEVVCDEGDIANCIGGCTLESWIGDNICDTPLNCGTFGWDGGDCTAPCGGGQVWDCAENCVNEGILGDGICQPEMDCVDTGWDGLDCQPACGENQVINCDLGCTSASWPGDGFCDSILNCAEWNYDEGDCEPPACGDGQCTSDETFEGCPEDCDQVFCEPYCGDAMCGGDGCGGSCGECDGDAVCNAGVCEDVGAQGACTNASDADIIDTQDIPGIAQEAALGCLGSPDSALCVQEAVSEATGLSSECSSCYGGLVNCIIANCLMSCISDAESPECVSCQQANCLPEFESCAFGDAACVPECNGATCGDDGCGGTCGACAGNESCEGGACVCTPDCTEKECGGDGCGGSCGECGQSESCGPTNQCGDWGEGNGAFCGLTPACQPTIPNPANPSEEIDNPDYPSCMSAQCASGFCLEDFAPGEVVFINTCSMHCTIVKDELNNRTGLPVPDGVEDEDTPWSDCTGFEGGGPAGTSYKCVSSGLPGQAAPALCVPGTTFQECDADGDCTDGETCQLTQLGGQMQERCFTAIQAGDWGDTTLPSAHCNDNPLEGDVEMCTGGLCFGLGCVHFCAEQSDCDTTKLEGSEGSCVQGTCTNWDGQTCETDLDCSAWLCREPVQLFTTLPSYQAEMCWPKSCGDIDECPDAYYCRWWWNGEPSIELGDWDHLCHREIAGGAALGEECDSDPADNVPGATCAAVDLCVGGRCSAVCSDDFQCATDGPAFQKCTVDEIAFDTDDDGFYDYILPLEYCRSFEGFAGDCFSETTCGDGETCTPYEIENWIEDPNNPGEMILHPDGGLILKGACTATDSGEGQWGDPCGLAGMAPCTSFCLGADEAAGVAGICTHLCESAADCPAFGEGDDVLQGRCNTDATFRTGWGGTFDKITDDLYYGLCIPSRPSSEQDCSDGGACPDSEACIAYQINFGPDYPATTEYICESLLTEAGEGGTVATGDTCDPEAIDSFGFSMADCAGAYCLADAKAADEADQTYYCSETCAPNSDTCGAGMLCHGGVSMPKAGVYESNQTVVHICRKDQECDGCGINSDCPGDRVCVNLGSGDDFFACVDACETSADCNGAACIQGMDVFNVISMGCFEPNVNKCD